MSAIIGQLLIGSDVIGELQGGGSNYMTNMLAAVARKRAGGGFLYYSTVFDGTNDFMVKSGGLTGITDSQKGLLSFWLKMGAGTDGDTEKILYNVGPFAVTRANDDQIRIDAQNSSGVTVLDIRSTNLGLVEVASGWVHVLASWDLSTAGRRYIYLNGVSFMNEVTFTVGETIDYNNGNDLRFGTQSAGVLMLNGLVSEVYWTNEWLAGTTALAAFNNSGHPKNLGANGSTPTGTQPLIYLHNPFSSFQTNLGSGGNFTVTGALGDGGSDKP